MGQYTGHQQNSKPFLRAEDVPSSRNAWLAKIVNATIRDGITIIENEVNRVALNAHDAVAMEKAYGADREAWHGCAYILSKENSELRVSATKSNHATLSKLAEVSR